MSQLPLSAFQTYNPADAASITPGPLALYAVPVDSLAPTQMNEGFTEVDTKAAAFDLLTPSELQADLLTDIEPVVIGPGGVLYLTDGHHTFTALEDSIYGASNPTVYVNVIANYSNLTEAQFFAQMQANNLQLPLNDGVPQTVNDATGAPIPTSLTGLTSDPYRGLEYSILKNKSSKIFATSSNITGAVGASTPGLDKMTGFYSDFLEAAAYRDADSGLGLPFLSTGDAALATQWNLTGSNLTTLPNVSGPVHVYQLPGFILSQNLVESSFAPGGISNATLASGALDGNGTFTGITEINAGTALNPIIIGTPNIGFIMELGGDSKHTVTLSSGNTYTGGTSILAGTLIITDDTSLGAATPANATVDPNNVKSSVQGDNGIIFNSLTEGNGTLVIGTTPGLGTATFSTNRPIAVGSEEATINLNGYQVTLNGQLVSLGTNNVGIGNATGYSDLTIDDNSSNKSVLYLATPSPYFWGNLIIGNANAPTVNVASDLAMGNTLANNPNDPIGEVELNGGTLQAGANFSATDRNVFLGGGSSFDVNGFATSWGSLTDVQRTVTVENSSTTSAGSVTFASLAIGSTAILAVDAGTGTAGGKGTTVIFANGITRSGNSDAGAPANATLFIDPSAGSTLGSSAVNGVEVFSSGASTALPSGIAPVWIITDSGGAANTNPYDFVTYSLANGYSKATYTSSFGAGNVVKSTGGTITSSLAYAINLQNGKTLTISGGSTPTLTVGDGTDPAGLILEGTTTITGGALAFGASEAVIDVKATNTISSAVTGTGGLTLSGSGTLVLSGAAGGLSGPIIIDSGTLQLSTANYFNAGTTLWLSNVKSKPSNSILAINSNQTFAALDSDATSSNSAITIADGDTLTIGDTTNNFSSTLPSTITATGTGSLVKAGSGLLDISSSGGVSFGAGTITVQGGVLRIGNGVFSTTATTAISLATGTELQYAGNGGSVFNDPVSGAGAFHLMAGTVKLTGTNTYSGGTVVETGATLDITTANLPSINENIVNAGGMVLFDQSTNGTFTGIIGDGQEMGTGPMESGSLDKDDSTGSNGGNVTVSSAQTYTGATYVEAGTLTLGHVDTIAHSSGVTLGRVGGGATATLALGANNTLAALSSDASNTTSVVLNGNVLTLDPTALASSNFGGAIVDGSAMGSLIIDGVGDAELSGASTFSGGTLIEGGTLELGNAQASGSGAITFAADVDPTLKIDLGDAPTNQINGFTTGDSIDLAGVGTETTFSYVGGVLTLSGGSQGVQLNVGPLPPNEGFVLAADGSGGTLVTAATEPGPTITPQSPSVVEDNQTTIIGSVKAGLTGDTLTLTQTGGTGTVSLGAAVSGVQQVTYTAPASIAASTIDAVSYTVADEYNDVVASGPISVQLDAGPTVASATPSTVEKGQTTVVGTVTAGIAGDTLTLTQSGGAGTLSLGAAVSGVQQVIYTAPASIATSAVDDVSYTVADQHNDVIASGSNSVQLDAGPTIASATPSTVEKGQTTVVGTVTAGIPGDTLTLTQTGGTGTLSLAAAVNGVQQVIYTAPVTIAASAVDVVSYTVADQHNDVIASGSNSVQLDAGPSITVVTPSVVENGQKTEIATVAPGLAGDTLSLNKTGGGGTLALQLVNGVEEVVYIAPASVAAGLLDVVSYTITDQHNDVMTMGSSTVPVAPAPDAIYLGTAGGPLNVGNGNSAIDGRAGNEKIQAGNGADVVFAGNNDTISVGNGSDTVLGGSNDTIQVGNGTDSISTGANASISGGNGQDAVTAGANARIMLGNGNNAVTLGANSTATLGNGNNTVLAGADDVLSLGNGQNQLVAGLNDAWTVGNGQDTFTFNFSGFGNNVINGFNTSQDVLQFNPALFVNYMAVMAETKQVGANAVITDPHGDQITLTGVTASHLTASNVKIT